MSQHLRPRLCVIEKGDSGYGFHLHGEKGKTGQYIRLVEPNSPADVSGLRAGDRVMFVEGESVEGESHQQVVSRIRAAGGKLELIVVDEETSQLLQKYNLKCEKEYVTGGIPVPGSDSDHEDEVKNGSSRGSSPAPDRNGERLSDSKDELRPRLCYMKRGSAGYGFNLHSERNKPGPYIRAVDDDSPAEKAGLRPQDKIIQVNGVSVLEMQHSEVVATIKAGGDETRLLVVDPDTDEFFRRCGVIPTEAHLTGSLPRPGSGGDTDGQFNGEIGQETTPKPSVSPSPSSTSSNNSINTAPAPGRDSPPPPEERSPVTSPALAMSLSLQEAKERARGKRSNKRAPAMDWSKRNELFSNL
ncbi:Na(+)/H(+) exchange regulatory cofactor NHE-RF1a isoform X2 [Chanos chanos]|uniref:Na(+)/H(+) exchange regulatory cofactor NHE-RF n=1 Tax=Chanos chanos TaxID=29144 RepID=A0A6J2VD06_CHACN|nr:Na(+)/H(+) exchange regulatory cofactor NHE-RF1-like isoform X2 [Chanos chanos]